MSPTPHARLEVLTKDQRRVLILIGEGHSYKDIARTLNISPATVEARRARIVALTGVSCVVQAVVLATKAGWL